MSLKHWLLGWIHCQYFPGPGSSFSGNPEVPAIGTLTNSSRKMLNDTGWQWRPCSVRNQPGTQGKKHVLSKSETLLGMEKGSLVNKF